MRHNFLILALAMALAHAACGADNSTTSATPPEPPPETSPKLGPGSNALPPVPTLEDVRMVAPALARYTQGALLGDVWKRADLSPRDRSIITVAALIARNQTIEMPYYFNLTLDSRVRPSQLSEIITHLAFYSGWGNAMSAVAVAKDIFCKRGVVFYAPSPG